jgi:signal transduction histidine kinase
MSRVVLHAWQVGWFVASVCFVLALPLRERRGRAPVSPVLVIGIASTALIVADATLALIRPEISFDDLGDFTVRPGFSGLEIARPAVWVFAIGSSLLLSVAAIRQLRAGGTLHLWLTAAFTLAASAQIGLLFHGTLGFEGVFSWAELFTTVAVALVFVGLLRDVRHESSFTRRATDRAEEVLGGRAEIASMVSHEIRGPVTTIRGLASTGDRHWDKLPETERREFLQLIAQESERLLHIADETSMALKVDAGTLVYVRMPADLAEVVREAVEKASTGSHPVTEDLEPGISLPLDRARFAEAITQLVENAAKFSPEAAPIEVRTHANAEAGQVVLEIVDRGPGIPPERREAAFRKFPGFRPPGYEEVPGTGLGLFICRAHVREHGGDVVATEASDGGTMLRITLPNQGEEEHGR